jgi:hypothetical protein
MRPLNQKNLYGPWRALILASVLGVLGTLPLAAQSESRPAGATSRLAPDGRTWLESSPFGYSILRSGKVTVASVVRDLELLEGQPHQLVSSKAAEAVLELKEMRDAPKAAVDEAIDAALSAVAVRRTQYGNGFGRFVLVSRQTDEDTSLEDMKFTISDTGIILKDFVKLGNNATRDLFVARSDRDLRFVLKPECLVYSFRPDHLRAFLLGFLRGCGCQVETWHAGDRYAHLIQVGGAREERGPVALPSDDGIGEDRVAPGLHRMQRLFDACRRMAGSRYTTSADVAEWSESTDVPVERELSPSTIDEWILGYLNKSSRFRTVRYPFAEGVSTLVFMRSRDGAASEKVNEALPWIASASLDRAAATTDYVTAWTATRRDPTALSRVAGRFDGLTVLVDRAEKRIIFAGNGQTLRLAIAEARAFDEL